jgi:hypothetical protein
MKILPVGTKLLPADGRTDGQTDRHDMTKQTVAFHNFANAPKNCKQRIKDLWHVKYRSQRCTGTFSTHNQPMGKSKAVSALTRNLASTHEGVWRSGGMT